MAEEGAPSYLPKTVFVLYLFVVSLAHEYGYWSNFHIQLLEHIGLSDLPKLAVWPILGGGGVLLVSSLLMQAHLATTDPSPPSFVAKTVPYVRRNVSWVGPLLLTRRETT